MTGPKDAIMLSAFAAMFVLSGYQLRRHWRGQGRRELVRGLWFLPVSSAAKRAMWRTFPLIYVATAAMFLAVIAGVVAGVSVLMFVALAVPWTAMVTALAIMLWNRPRSLVAPPYRRERGLVSLWIRGRRVRRAATRRRPLPSR
ncbi:hypothetical protein ACIBTV_13705 [Micromonospora sp. NPDC049366]|uniref:hypothetical protein n=1 Tax=Micromonospora sp. NPDC049366 TaxID=3364271 RepID=UPI0037A23DAC